MRFSERTGWDTGEHGLARTVREARAAGQPLVDLTVANPTACGFEYDSEAILGALGHPAAMTYDPDARGIRSAREAVAAYYADHGATVDPDAVVLTTSTSEAYSFLFRLLCDPGDAVLVAQPSYPLFDFLADLDDVRVEPIPACSMTSGGGSTSRSSNARSGRGRGLWLVVHPNNPDGSRDEPRESGFAPGRRFCARAWAWP